MKTHPNTASWRRRAALMAAAVALVTTLSGPAAYADITQTFPGESPGHPAYARTLPASVAHTEEWAAVPFYRLPTCVPEDFDLLQFFDIPRAFGCPLTVSGRLVTESPEALPKVVVTRGRGVPVWFASWADVQGAMTDGGLTIEELSALDSLVVGTADVYQELLRPDELLVVNARGTLADGRSFRLHVKYSIHDEAPHVSIVIR